MGQIFDTVVEFFQEDGWPIVLNNEEDTLLRIAYSGNGLHDFLR